MRRILNCFFVWHVYTPMTHFDKQKLFHLAEFYPNDFSLVDLVALEKFSGLKGIGELVRKFVEIKKDQLY